MTSYADKDSEKGVKALIAKQDGLDYEWYRRFLPFSLKARYLR